MQLVLGRISGDVIVCLKNVRIWNDILNLKCQSCAAKVFSEMRSIGLFDFLKENEEMYWALHAT